MNDRFKFRIWWKKENRYRIDTDIIPIGHLTDFANNNKYVVEQCTGLKDKNGNLIYEGDIVSGRYFNPYHPETPNPDIKGVVRFIQDRMTWIIEDGDEGYDIEDCIPEYFEIIGNIHEQAEQKD